MGGGLASFGSRVGRAGPKPHPKGAGHGEGDVRGNRCPRGVWPGDDAPAGACGAGGMAGDERSAGCAPPDPAAGASKGKGWCMWPTRRGRAATGCSGSWRCTASPARWSRRRGFPERRGIESRRTVVTHATWRSGCGPARGPRGVGKSAASRSADPLCPLCLCGEKASGLARGDAGYLGRSSPPRRGQPSPHPSSPTPHPDQRRDR